MILRTEQIDLVCMLDESKQERVNSTNPKESGGRLAKNISQEKHSK